VRHGEHIAGGEGGLSRARILQKEHSNSSLLLQSHYQSYLVASWEGSRECRNSELLKHVARGELVDLDQISTLAEAEGPVAH
jgi:hypothetical protein